jgi:hypothetical protein
MLLVPMSSRSRRGCFRGVVVERPDVSFEEGDHPHRRRGDNARAATARGQHGDFSDDVAGPECTNRLPVAGDVRGAGLDRVEAVPELTLPHQHVALLDLQLADPGGYGCELRLGKRREEWYRRKPLSIHARTLLADRRQHSMGMPRSGRLPVKKW